MLDIKDNYYQETDTKGRKEALKKAYNYFKNKIIKVNDKILIGIIQNFFRQINNLWDIICSDGTGDKKVKDPKISKYILNRTSQSNL